jgi:hypothetical protein
MDEDRIDLTLLDPSRDARRWDLFAESIVNRAMTARQGVSFRDLLFAWSRPALAFAVVVALLSVAGASLSGRNAASSVTANQEPVTALFSWAAAGHAPSADTILGTLGGENESK